MASALQLLSLGLRNGKTLTLDSNGPVPTIWRAMTSHSQPIPSAELEWLRDKTTLVTGATSGCGLELAKILARYSARLIITARNEERGQRALADIQDSLGTDRPAQIDVWQLDMASFDSIRMFIQRVSRLETLDFLVLNAGVLSLPFDRSPASWEMHLQVNYLGQCALILSLLPVLNSQSQKRTTPARVLNVTSEAHLWESIPLTTAPAQAISEFNDETALDFYQRYRRSKLLSMMWTHTLASAWEATDSVVIATATPGLCQTPIYRQITSSWIADALIRWFLKTSAHGAWDYVRALMVPASQYHGQFFYDGCPAECVHPSELSTFDLLTMWQPRR